LPVNVDVINGVVADERTELERLTLSIWGYMGYLTRLFYVELERAGRGDLVARLRELARRGIAIETEIEPLLPTLTGRAREYGRQLVELRRFSYEVYYLVTEPIPEVSPVELPFVVEGRKRLEISLLSSLHGFLRGADWAGRLRGLVGGVIRRIRDWLSRIFGALFGRVTDEGTGAPIAGARIEVIELGMVATSDSEGRYSITHLPIGTYEVSCYTEQYSEERATVVIEGAAVTVQDFVLSMVLPQLYRILIGRMYYRNYKIGKTPDPFAFVACFVYTTDLKMWTTEEVKKALDWITTDPRAGFSLAWSLSGVRTRKGKRDGRVPEGMGAGAYYQVLGVEVEKVDWDEFVKGELVRREETEAGVVYYGSGGERLSSICPEDQLRYYALFYRIVIGKPSQAGEYWGHLEGSHPNYTIVANDEHGLVWSEHRSPALRRIFEVARGMLEGAET